MIEEAKLVVEEGANSLITPRIVRPYVLRTAQ
jgi:hypothetical protein